MIADLHCHYPMHVMMEEPRERLDHVRRARGRPLRDKLRAVVLRVASALFSDPGLWSEERVNLAYLEAGDVRVVFSVLHSPFAEWDLELRYGSPPESHYFPELIKQIGQVEDHLNRSPHSVVTVVRNKDELDRALNSGAIAFVHCLEGGVDLGPSTDEIKRNVAELKRRGVAYITLAHLFYRQVATNTPALPFLHPSVYNFIFRQPKGQGLTDRGRAAVEAMVDNRILVDLAHMRADALEETFEILKRVPDMPVINSHASCRCGKKEYMPDARTVERIAERRGVVGLIMGQHLLNDGIRKKETESYEESFEVIRTHIDKLHVITGSHEFTAIGTDFDGFIKPTMGGLENMGDLARLEAELNKEYGAATAKLITSDNAIRVLRTLWG